MHAGVIITVKVKVYVIPNVIHLITGSICAGGTRWELGLSRRNGVVSTGRPSGNSAYPIEYQNQS